MSPGTHVCAVCSDNFIVNSKCIKCDNCESVYHLVCIKVKDQLMKLKQESNNVMWFCNDCLQEVVIKLKKPVDDFNEKAKVVIEKTEKLINLIQKQQQPMYSEVVKNRNNVEPLIIKPKKLNQNSTITKNVLEQKISPADIAASISKVKQASHGCVVVHCEDKKSLENLKTKTQDKLGKDYVITTGKMLNPKIKIVNVKEEQLKDVKDFVINVANQNLPDDLKDGIQFVRKFKTQKNINETCNVILELSTEQYNFLRNKRDHLYIGWNSYRYFEFISVLRCFKCWKFGHQADKCSGDNTCPMCNKNHKKDECKSNSYECTNCKYAIEVLKISGISCNHHVFDANCPSYQKQVSHIKEKIKYDI